MLASFEKKADPRETAHFCSLAETEFYKFQELQSEQQVATQFRSRMIFRTKQQGI